MRRINLTLLIAFLSLVAGSMSLKAQLTQLVGITNSIWSYNIDNSDQYALGFPNLDDSTWLQSRGLFGNDAGYPYPYQVTVAGSSGGIQSSYYRTRFNWAGSPSGVVLVMTNYIDDGLVIYLNGVEIHRYNVVDNPVTHNSQAPVANPAGEGVVQVYNVTLDAMTNGNANPLIAGENVLSVSVHQAGTGSSDSVFGLSVYASQIVAPCVASVTPATSTVVECRNATFNAVLPPNCGIPTPTIQWYRNVGFGDEMIVGQTGASLTVTNVSAADTGDYFVILTNPGGNVPSSRAQMTVVADTEGPQVVSFVFTGGAQNSFVVTYDEPVVDSSGTDTFIYSIISSDGLEALVVETAVVGANPSEFLLTTLTAPTLGRTYNFTIGDDFASVLDACKGNGSSGLTGSVLFSSVILAADDPTHQWRYDDNGVDQGTAWIQSAYDDSAWKTGVGVFDGKDVPRTVVSGLNVGTQLQRRIPGTAYETVNVPTMYFRTRLTIPAGSAGVSVRTVADDAYVLYVNGVEVSRLRAPVANDGFATYSGGGTVGDGNYEGPVTIPLNLINVGGENVFAALLKQNDATSSDITWGLEVTALVPGITVEAPVILQDPASVTVTEGHSFSLSVVVSGTEPTIQWFKDGNPISGANSATYSIVAAGDSAGSYYAVASNSAGSDQSEPAIVTVRPVVAAYGAVWKYNETSQDGTLGGGTPWYGVGFDDSTWASGPGPLGIETTGATIARLPAPIATALQAPAADRLAVFFRGTVTAPTLGAGETLVLTHIVDDGAVVYVDGVEAFRYNMPSDNPVLSTTLASGTAPGDGDANLVSIPVTLSPGPHLVAVEVHQNSATSSDVVFGAELRVITGAAPSLTITQPSAGNVSVTWAANPLYSLYQATDVAGPYTAVGGNPQGTYNLAIPAADTARFFQIRFNGR